MWLAQRPQVNPLLFFTALLHLILMQPFILIRNFLLKIDCILSIDPAYLVVLCEEELVVIDLVTKEAG